MKGFQMINIGLQLIPKKVFIVPVVRDVDKRDLQTLGEDFAKRVEEVRTNKILPNFYPAATLRLRIWESMILMASLLLINLPEAAILGVRRITPNLLSGKRK